MKCDYCSAPLKCSYFNKNSSEFRPVNCFLLDGTKLNEKYGYSREKKQPLAQSIRNSNGGTKKNWMKTRKKVTCSLHSIFLLIVKSISDAKWHVKYENIVNGFGV